DSVAPQLLEVDRAQVGRDARGIDSSFAKHACRQPGPGVADIRLAVFDDGRDPCAGASVVDLERADDQDVVTVPEADVEAGLDPKLVAYLKSGSSSPVGMSTIGAA